MKKKFNIMCWILTPLVVIAISIYYKVQNIPATIFVRQGESLYSSGLIKLKEEVEVNSKIPNNRSNKKVNVNFLGVLPVKSVSVQSVPEIMVYPGGQPVGVKLNTKGVLVVALSDLEGKNGKIQSPAALAGIEVGDAIIKVDNKEINKAEELSTLVNTKDKEYVLITLLRKDKVLEFKVKPVENVDDGKYKIGLWVRDSTAGVGTLTFYHKESGKFGALGHPITDVDTGSILNVKDGKIITSNIISVRKGIKGKPGELRGIFVEEDKSNGEIYKNTQCGVFGKGKDTLINSKFNEPMKIALRNEIKEGKAQILTTVEGCKTEIYNIEIEKLLLQDVAGPKSMIIKVTDQRLLEKTGGIVQGMSGSPIIQNNKIVGAVTHVLINKPDTGYGIYIEWMIKDSDILSK